MAGYVNDMRGAEFFYLDICNKNETCVSLKFNGIKHESPFYFLRHPQRNESNHLPNRVGRNCYTGGTTIKLFGERNYYKYSKYFFRMSFSK